MSKKITQQLKNLKSIKADDSWKKEGELFLYAQISREAKQVSRFNFSMLWARDFLKAISQPAFALGAFVLILLTGVIFSHPFLGQAMPNDSLYIARILSEKAQVNMTFDSQSRNKLTAKFASNHAKDITTVLSNPNFDHGDNEKTVAKLNQDFKDELAVVKDSLGKINQSEKQNKKDVNLDNDKNDSGDKKEETGDLDSFVFAVDSEKDDKGIEVSVSKDPVVVDINNNDTSKPNSTSSSEITTLEPAVSSSSSSTDIIDEVLNSLNEVDRLNSNLNNVDTNKTLDEVKDLFDQAKYSEALEKLSELDNMINDEEQNDSEENIEEGSSSQATVEDNSDQTN